MNFIKRKLAEVIVARRKNIARAKEEKRAKDMSKISYSRMYIGLSAEDVSYENQLIRKAVLNLVRPSVPTRLLHSYNGPHIKIEPLENFNGHKCFKITYWCYSKEQYCIECSSYGCPGGC